MSTILVWVGLGLLGLVLMGAVGWGLHLACVQLEDRGYIYYRSKPSGGGSAVSALCELDRLSRPSLQHVVEAQDYVAKKRDDEAGAGE